MLRTTEYASTSLKECCEAHLIAPFSNADAFLIASVVRILTVIALVERYSKNVDLHAQLPVSTQCQFAHQCVAM